MITFPNQNDTKIIILAGTKSNSSCRCIHKVSTTYYMTKCIKPNQLLHGTTYKMLLIIIFLNQKS